MQSRSREEQVLSAALKLFLSSHSTLLSPLLPQKSWVGTFEEIFEHHCCLKQMCILPMIIEIKFSILEKLFGEITFSTAKKLSKQNKTITKTISDRNHVVSPYSGLGFLGSCLLGFRLLQIQTETFLDNFSKASSLFDEICHCRTDLIFFSC